MYSFSRASPVIIQLPKKKNIKLKSNPFSAAECVPLSCARSFVM